MGHHFDERRSWPSLVGVPDGQLKASELGIQDIKGFCLARVRSMGCDAAQRRCAFVPSL